MPEFSYQAKNDSGELVTGQISADNVTEAIAHLEESGLSIKSIGIASDVESQEPKEQHRDQSTGRRHEPSASFTLDDRFATALERRGTLMPALGALADEMPSGRGRTEIRELTATLGKAETAADLRRSKIATQWLPLLVTGISDESNTRRLSDLVDQTSRESESRNQRRRFLAYPLIVLGIALALFSILCAIIVPTFASMFREFGLMLPSPTRFVVHFADQLSGHPIRTLISAALAGTVIYGIARLWTHFAMTTRVFGVFTAGNSANVSAMSTLTRQMAELLSIGVSLPDALWIAGESCQHFHFKKVTEHLARDAHRGKLSGSTFAHNLPPNVIHALETGADGGPSIPLLRQLSTMYGDRVAERVDWTTGAMAQITLVIVGVVIGFFVLALFAPMVSLITGLS